MLTKNTRRCSRMAGHARTTLGLGGPMTIDEYQRLVAAGELDTVAPLLHQDLIA